MQHNEEKLNGNFYVTDLIKDKMHIHLFNILNSIKDMDNIRL